MDCDCFCHIAEHKEHQRTKAERTALWEAELARREQERFAKEGVYDWEKKTLEYIMYYPKNINQLYRDWLAASGREPEETGAQFIDRMLRSPWGSQYIRKQGTLGKSLTEGTCPNER